jgi:hypothetical protein
MLPVPKEIVLVPKEMLASPSGAAKISYLLLAQWEKFSWSPGAMVPFSYGFVEKWAWHGPG